MLRLSFIIGCALLLCGALPAQTAQSSVNKCRTFDFFIGDWVVKDRMKHAVATDFVSKPNGNCTLIEKWRASGAGGEGLAVITYQPKENLWHRDALIRSSVVLGFDGQISGDSMVMTAKQYSESGISALHRITWTPKSDGSVEETWQTSTDAGKSWNVRFDEILTRFAE